ncbi:YbaY family lipoprotein [Hymenobacter sublimis]|uniref:YbaY family lipoprotein n=1 Tax=Hymenobacter sublimis TaxID=2933777 RepID=A0ABY4J535_9BACT|nr:YbaY family lipoprotein [Hymenobacter sublimis]UPL47949.1 YbaY family lipoprotein [Hymenobacter sublimis]
MKSGLLCAFGLLLLASCTATPSAPGNAGSRPTPVVVKDSITGSVAYRERIALSPTAVVRVHLLDVSLQDVAATVIDSVTIRPNGRQVPLPFTLRYDTARIRPNYTYTVQARITDGGRLLFRTDVAYPVLTRGNPKRVELLLRRASQ